MLDPGTMQVRDLMTAEVITLGRNDKLAAADAIMKSRRIRHLVILDEEGDLAGVLSDRDLLRGALVRAMGFAKVAQGRIMETIAIKEVMSTSPQTIHPQAPIAEAARIMRRSLISCLPVVEARQLVGVLTEGDFVQYWTEAGANEPR